MTVLRQDPFFGRILDEAEAKGRVEGKAEGWRDGLRAGRIADLAAILKARRWTAADHVVDAAHAADTDTLGEMITAAVTIGAVEDFMDRFGIEGRPGSGS